MKAERTVKRITFDRSEASPGETLYVSVSKLNKNEVLVPGSLALIFNIDLAGGDPNNFLVQNVSLVDRMAVKFGEILQDTVGYIFKIWEDLFLAQEDQDNMLLEGIQTEKLCKIRSNAGDKETMGVDAEKALEAVFSTKYRIKLDQQILTDHGIFYPHALFNNLLFELTLAPGSQVVKGSDTTKLKYKLINIQLEYEMIRRNEKEFAYDHVMREEVFTFKKGSDTRINLRVNPQRRSLKGILLLFVEPYTAGDRDSEKYIYPDLTKVSVTVNGSPNMVYNNGIEGKDFWEEAYRFFKPKNNKKPFIDMTKFYTKDNFGLLIDLRSMRDQSLHGNSTHLVNTKDGVQLELKRKASGSGEVKCHVFVISDSQMNIIGQQLESV